MDWKKHLKTEEDLDSGEYAYRLVEVIMHMKDRDLWIPIRVLEDYVGSSFEGDLSIESELKIRDKMGWFENPEWDDQIFPLEYEIRTDTEGVEHIRFQEGPVLSIPGEDILVDEFGKEYSMPHFKRIFREDLQDDSSLADVDKDEGDG